MSAADGWNRTKLRSWLIVEYGMAVEWTRSDEAHPWLHPSAGMDDAYVQMAVEDGRRRVTKMIASAEKAWSAPVVASQMVERNLLLRVVDTTSRIAYAPISREDMTFLDRLESLFVADYLAYPGFYRNVRACAGCGEIPIHGRVRHGRSCTISPPADSASRESWSASRTRFHAP